MSGSQQRVIAFMPNPQAPHLRKIILAIVAVGVLLYLNFDEEGQLMDTLFASKPGRILLATAMTVLVLFTLYRGRTVGRFEVDADESPNSFGCVVIVEALVAAMLWISLLF
jgi:hypothetical protein